MKRAVHLPGVNGLAAPELDWREAWRVSMAQVRHCHDLLRAFPSALALRRHVETLIRLVRAATAIAWDSTAASNFSAMTSATATTISACVCLVSADMLCSRSRFCLRPSAGTTVVVWWRRMCWYRRRRICWGRERSFGGHLATISVLKRCRLRAVFGETFFIATRPRISARYRRSFNV